MLKQNRDATAERRAQVRYSHALRTTCRPLGRQGGGSWSARVRDVSRSGAALRMSHEVRPGEVLVVALEGCGGRFVRPLLMRVVRTRPDGEGTWNVGCTFVTPLADNDLQSLLLAGQSADGGPSPLSF
jgi:hypothetical protein